MIFYYKAKNLDGTIVEGQAEAVDRFALSRQMRDGGMILLSAKDKALKNTFDLQSLNNLLSTVKLHDKIIFTRNLSAMLSAGLALSRSLAILEKQTQNIKFKKVLGSIIEDINKGGTLSAGMKKFPKIFSPLFISMVRAGEESGGMPEALNMIGIQLEKSYTMTKKIKGALIYPAVIITAIIGIGALMLVYVVPTLTSTFRELNVSLPKSTQAIIFVSEFLVQHTIAFIVIIVSSISIFVWSLKTKVGGRIFDLVCLKLPVISELIKEVNSARTARTLSSLLSSGVSIEQSLEITEDVLQNSYYKEVIHSAGASITKGLPLSQLFKNRSDIYPVLVGEMIEVGEETGKMSDMLMNIANFYEEEVDSATKDLSTIIEPLLMVVIGVAVGFFAVSMITPMYSLLNNI